MPERKQNAPHQAPQENETPTHRYGADKGNEPNISAMEEERTIQLTRAVSQLLDALDRCAGDPPDCPHCGPARTYASTLLDGEPNRNDKLQNQEGHERLILSGRAGADPTFRTTSKGTVVARFPLAVPQQDNSTKWLQIVAFNQRGERLRDSLKKGQLVNVVGYEHSREAPTRDGGTRTIKEIYAVTITSPTAR